jgi:hypothetical protein
MSRVAGRSQGSANAIAAQSTTNNQSRAAIMVEATIEALLNEAAFFTELLSTVLVEYFDTVSLV